MTLKAAAHSHASQLSIYDLPMVSASPLIINSRGQIMQLKSFEYQLLIDSSAQVGWMSQGVTRVTGKLIIHSCS